MGHSSQDCDSVSRQKWWSVKKSAEKRNFIWELQRKHLKINHSEVPEEVKAVLILLDNITKSVHIVP